MTMKNNINKPMIKLAKSLFNKFNFIIANDIAKNDTFVRIHAKYVLSCANKSLANDPLNSTGFRKSNIINIKI